MNNCMKVLHSYNKDCAECNQQKIENLKAENAELKKTISKLLSDLAESDNKRGARETGLVEKNAELKAKYEKLELMYAEALQAEINWSVQEALDYIREEMANE